MKIELKKISIRELTAGYQDMKEGGVTGYGGKLDIRPAYQREFVYKDKQREAVINSVTKNFPLNVMYWAVNSEEEFEVIDGQQRTISICQYVNGEFGFNGRYFHNLQQDEKDQILDYNVMVYFCSGTDSQKLDWFRTINISGEKLTSQELRNAVYSGPWVSDAKKYFSKTKCPAYEIASDYLNGSPIRQDYLQTALKWVSNNKVEEYMGKHQSDPDAEELWRYFKNVISWVQATFIKKRKKMMKGVDWGLLYNEFGKNFYDQDQIESDTARLILDDDVTNKKGIYRYILTGDEKYLSIRAFSDQMKQKVYERQGGRCNISGKELPISEMEADHITPWSLGGKTNEENCQMISKEENRRKSNK